MFINFFKIAYRSLLKNTVYSFINIFGLSIGIACSILIMLWVADELSYDQFNANYNSLYKVYKNTTYADGVSSSSPVPYPLKEAIQNKSSQVKYLAMTNWGEGNLLTVGDKRLSKFGISVTEDFLKMFSFDMIQGDPQHALDDPRSIVLTESTASALFGKEDPINQLVKIDNRHDLKVTGIVRDVHKQSTITFDYLMPFAFFESTMEWVRNSRTSWENNSFQLYAMLQPDVNPEEVNKAIASLVKENTTEQEESSLFLYPMNQWRLYTKFENGKVAGGMIFYVRLFTGIAIFILLIACINFMNLATARSESRAREVGIRKSIGSRRKELIWQFLGESLVITFLAFLVAMLIVELVLPLYNILVDKNLFISYGNPLLWISAASIILLTGLIAGSYPAFYLSSFQPVKVLKGKIQAGRHASLPRKILVTLQFGFSILLIVGTIVIFQQIKHVKDRELGYDRENLMMIWTTSEIETSFATIKEELIKTGAVKAVCKSNSPITAVFSSNTPEWAGMTPGTRVSFATIATEYDYAETMGIKMLQGRDFSREFKSDSSGIIVNQAAVDVMGFDEPLGQKMKMWGREWTIIGVMPNVVMDSPYHPIEPLVMVFQPDWSSTITLRMEKTTDMPSSIAKVENVFKKYNPAYPFQFRFADFDYEKKFSSINLTSKLANLFTSLAIIITCLGLFGLAAFTAEQRTKEIGIRKVMGASVTGLVALISRDFSRLVIIAFAISAPLAWWALDDFLKQFPYRTEISWWILPLAGCFALVLTLIIVSTQALKAATTNPARSLRSE